MRLLHQFLGCLLGGADDGRCVKAATIAGHDADDANAFARPHMRVVRLRELVEINIEVQEWARDGHHILTSDLISRGRRYIRSKREGLARNPQDRSIDPHGVLSPRRRYRQGEDENRDEQPIAGASLTP